MLVVLYLWCCDYDICTGQGVLIASNMLLIIKGQFKSHTPERSAVKISLQYVVSRVREQDEGTTKEEGSCDAWVVKDLGVLSAPAWQIVVPAKELASTYHAVASAKKGLTGTRPARGSFCTHFRAEIMSFEAQRASSWCVYSSEVFVCCERNLRRMSKRQDSSVKAATVSTVQCADP